MSLVGSIIIVSKKKWTDNHEDDSPLQPLISPGGRNIVGTGRPLEAISVDDLASMGVSMEAVMKTLERKQGAPTIKAHRLTKTEHPSSQTLSYIGGYPYGYLPSSSAIADPPTSLLQPSTLSSYQTEPDFKTADIDELNASLGLPGAKIDAAPKASPAPGHRSRASQGTHDDTLYGKLIGRAMTKPMTADALARYMQSRSESSEETVRPPRERSHSLRNPDVEEAPTLKFVRAPPGFGDQQPRIVAEEAQQVLMDPATFVQNVAPVPAGYVQQQHHVPQSTISYQSPARGPSTTRRIRSYTRTRRTDQGPEPSAADIYPDDAHWTPPQATPRYHRAASYVPSTPSYMPPTPQTVVRAEDSTAWPTPAEVYDPKTKTPTSAHVTQTCDTKEVHVPPTAEDFAAADAAVLSLLDELPEPKINTLLNFGALDLLADERPLSPAQDSGKRYGLQFHGIGLADPWLPPQASEGDPFRVRPRNHEGWGGWEWALKNGWAMQ